MGRKGVRGVPRGLINGRAEEGTTGTVTGVSRIETGVPCTESVLGIPVLTRRLSRPECPGESGTCLCLVGGAMETSTSMVSEPRPQEVVDDLGC